MMDVCIRTVKTNRTVLIFLTVTFCLILPACLHGNSFSVYFTQFGSHLTKNDMRKENSKRLKQAEQYFKDLSQDYNGNGNMDSNMELERIDIAIVVITVSRNRHMIDEYEPKYLTQTLMKLYELREQFKENSMKDKTPGVTQEELDSFFTNLETNANPDIIPPEAPSIMDKHYWYKTHLSVCNVDHDISSYDEAKLMGKVVLVFNRFEKLHFSMTHVLEKEKQDYMFCLNHTLQLKPRYVLLVEDDAYPLDNMFPVLVHTIRTHLDTHSARGNIQTGPRKDNAFVKLYHPERLQNYLSVDFHRLTELLALSLTMSSVTVLLYTLIFIDRKMSTYYVWALWTLYYILVLIAIGHPNVVQLREIFSPYFYSVRPAPSCCTPAMLFPAKSAFSVVNYMHSKQCSNNYGKDSVLDDMLRDLELGALYVEPNVFRHIGMYSALKTTFVDPKLV